VSRTVCRGAVTGSMSDVPPLRWVSTRDRTEPYVEARTPRQVSQLRARTGLAVQLGDKIPQRLVR
jgi:hypothetical protein